MWTLWSTNLHLHKLLLKFLSSLCDFFLLFNRGLSTRLCLIQLFLYLLFLCLKLFLPFLDYFLYLGTVILQFLDFFINNLLSCLLCCLQILRYFCLNLLPLFHLLGILSLKSSFLFGATLLYFFLELLAHLFFLFFCFG